MISEEVEFGHVSDMAKYKAEKIENSFNQYLRIFTPVVAGVIWLSRQPGLTALDRTRYLLLSDMTVLLLMMFSTIMVIENSRSWRGYRNRLADLINRNSDREPVPPAKSFPAFVDVGTMIFVMYVAVGLFIWFNPIRG